MDLVTPITLADKHLELHRLEEGKTYGPAIGTAAESVVLESLELLNGTIVCSTGDVIPLSNVRRLRFE